MEVIPACQALAVEDRLVAHRRQDRQKPRPGDVLVATLDAGNRALAGACPVCELALAEPMLGAELLDEFAGRFDAVYGIKGI
jgi:hypothetical protein